LHPDVGVIALVPERWGDHWMSRHHVLTRLSHHFHVVWMNPAYNRTELRSRLGRPPFRTIDGHPNFVLYDPDPWLPELHRPTALGAALDRLRLVRARAELKRRGCARFILYLWRPAFAGAAERIEHDALCYHIVDEYTFSSVDLPIPATEAELIRRADQVIIHTQALFDKKGGLNPTSCVIPLGVDFDAFATPSAAPSDIEAIPRPRIGYTGHLKKQLDWPLLLELARKHPEWSWVFIGGRLRHAEIDAPITELAELPNVHFLGSKPSSEMPRYVQHLDVGIMPYVLDDYATYGSPLKLQEYLAAGLPAVGVPMRALTEHAGVVQLADGLEEWDHELERALSPDARLPHVVDARRNHARPYRWDELVDRIAALLLDSLTHAS
jgi:hypothetical protein